MYIYFIINADASFRWLSLIHIYPDAYRLEKSLGNGPAVYYSAPGFAGEIGVIGAIHEKFCNTCNRILSLIHILIEPGPLASYVGFTETEVQKLCGRYDMELEEVKSWYDGYSFDKALSVYLSLIHI